MCMSVPTVQEQMIVQEIPGAQVVERIQKQIAETIPQERQRTVEQIVKVPVPTVRLLIRRSLISCETTG